MNDWYLSGEVIKHGIKGNKYPILWIQALLSSPKELGLSDNRLFINFAYDNDPNSKAGRTGSYIKDKLVTGNKYFFLSNATVGPVKLSKKNDQGEWETDEVIGVKGNINKLHIANTRYPDFNVGYVEGKMLNYFESNDVSKFLISESYRNIQDNSWKTREIPIMSPTADLPATSGTFFVCAALCGKTLVGEDKVYGYTRKSIKLY